MALNVCGVSSRSKNRHAPGVRGPSPAIAPCAKWWVSNSTGSGSIRGKLQAHEGLHTRILTGVAQSNEHYPGERPIFDLYGTEDEIERALHRSVQLKSGGHLVIDQTEAMTTIDVNTGLTSDIAISRRRSSRPTSKQHRLSRDSWLSLGGIIVIGFIGSRCRTPSSSITSPRKT